MKKKQKIKIGLLLFLPVLILSLLTVRSIADPSKTVLDAQTVLPEFQPLVPTLQQNVGIRVLLPTYYPTEALVEEPGAGELTQYVNVPISREGQFAEVHPYLAISDDDEYEVDLDALNDCMGANSCSFGFISGKRIYFDTPPITETYSFHKDPEFQPPARSPEAEEFGPISLSNGRSGFFIPYVCGASCDTSKVIWDEEGIRYTVGIRYAAKATMIQMAESAIVNTTHEASHQ